MQMQTNNSTLVATHLLISKISHSHLLYPIIKTPRGQWWGGGGVKRPVIEMQFTLFVSVHSEIAWKVEDHLHCQKYTAPQHKSCMVPVESRNNTS